MRESVGGPGFLPESPMPLIGCGRELTLVLARLRDPGVRLLTLTGPGGVGKTRLAQEVALALAPELPDGACFVPLAAVHDPTLVADVVAHALGVRVGGGRPPLQALGDAVRRRNLLLVLDNLEHLLDAAPLVADLLAVAAGLKVLATSREVLRLRGEQEVPVPPLALPAARSRDLDEIGGSPAVALFTERVRAVRHDFVLTPAIAGDVAGICRRLDGLPLAIELGAARLKHLSPAALLRRLDRRLDVLTDGARDLPPRLRTMTSAIAWSHDLLTPAEQVLFRRLAVFAGGFTLEAAEGVTLLPQPASLGPPPPIPDLLASLVDKSLLVRREASTGDGSTIGYRMLETIREYAWARLVDSGEADLLAPAHATYYRDVAEAAVLALLGPQQAVWAERVEADIDNFRAALDWAASDRGEVETGLRLGAALWSLWCVRGLHLEGAARLDALLARPAAAAPSIARGRALVASGWVALNAAQPERAQTLLAEALALFDDARDDLGRALALVILGFASLFGGRDAATAATRFDQSRPAARAAGASWLEAAAVLGSGWSALLAQRLDQAQTAAEDARRRFEALGDDRGAATSVTVLASVARARGMISESLAHQRGALARYLRIGDRENLARSLEAIAGLLGVLGRPERAARLFGAAEALRDAVAVPRDTDPRFAAQPDLAAVQAALGEAGFAPAAAEGQSLTLDEAVAEAIAGESGGAAAGAASPTPATTLPAPGTIDPRLGRLTIRQREVLQLVATGHIDKEIGAALGISRETSSKHMANVCRTLGVPSRAAAAAVIVPINRYALGPRSLQGYRVFGMAASRPLAKLAGAATASLRLAPGAAGGPRLVAAQEQALSFS